MELKQKTIDTLKKPMTLSEFLKQYREWIMSKEAPKNDFEEACNDLLENSYDGRDTLVDALKIAGGDYTEKENDLVKVELNK